MASARDPFDRETHRRAWAALTFSDRRRILRAVNRGRALDGRADARLAVGAARQQMRFWRWVWIVAPVVALPQLSKGLDVFVANVVVGTLVVGGMAAWFHRQARLAEAANIEIARPKGKRPKGKRPKG